MAGLREAIADWGGVGSLVGTSLVVGLGAAMVASHAGPFREAVRERPFVRNCQPFLEAPRTARWVSVNGCLPDPDAVARAGAAPLSRGEASLVPLRSVDQPPPTPARVLLSTTDTALALGGADGGAPVLKTLTGLVVEWEDGVPPAGVATHDAVVLVEGARPPRARPIGVVLFGVALMAWAFLPLVRRVELYRLR